MKLTYRYFLLLVFSVLSLQAGAQGFSIGALGGLSIPNLTAQGSAVTPLSEGYKSRVGGQVGISGEYGFSKLFSLQVLLEYSQQGGDKNGYQAYPTPEAVVQYYQSMQQPPPTYLYADFKSQAKINYLMIPVLAKFGWDLGQSPFRVYVNGGPFVSFLLSAHQVTSGNSVSYDDRGGAHNPVGPPSSFDHTQNIASTLHNANFGLEGHVGIAYKMGQHSIFIQGGGNYGFVEIQKGSANGKNNTGAGTCVIGYNFWFKKKA